jgi:hypothetical protein
METKAIGKAISEAIDKEAAPDEGYGYDPVAHYRRLVDKQAMQRWSRPMGKHTKAREERAKAKARKKRR